MGHGGRRPGAGKKKGYKHTRTLEKEAAGALLREMVSVELEPLVAAQIHDALGVKHLMFRDAKTGWFERVTDETQI